MSEQSTAELFKKIAEPVLRQCLFVGSLVLMAMGESTLGALAYLFFFALNWASGAVRVRKASSTVDPTILQVLPGRLHIAIARAVRTLSLAGILFWIYDVQAPMIWCLVPALVAALSIDATLRSRAILLAILGKREVVVSRRALLSFGVVFGVVTDIPVVLLNLFLALPSLDFLRRS